MALHRLGECSRWSPRNVPSEIPGINGSAPPWRVQLNCMSTSGTRSIGDQWLCTALESAARQGGAGEPRGHRDQWLCTALESAAGVRMMATRGGVRGINGSAPPWRVQLFGMPRRLTRDAQDQWLCTALESAATRARCILLPCVFRINGSAPPWRVQHGRSQHVVSESRHASMALHRLGECSEGHWVGMPPGFRGINGSAPPWRVQRESVGERAVR